jgi:hypothetical protein
MEQLRRGREAAKPATRTDSGTCPCRAVGAFAGRHQESSVGQAGSDSPAQYAARLREDYGLGVSDRDQLGGGG